MADPILDIKPVAGTIDDGRRVTFNQVVMRKQADPAGVLLVAIDPDVGLLVWLRPHSVIKEIARVQVLTTQTTSRSMWTRLRRSSASQCGSRRNTSLTRYGSS